MQVRKYNMVNRLKNLYPDERSVRIRKMSKKQLFAVCSQLDDMHKLMRTANDYLRVGLEIPETIKNKLKNYKLKSDSVFVRLIGKYPRVERELKG